jgi:hypothetical protein
MEKELKSPDIKPKFSIGAVVTTAAGKRCVIGHLRGIDAGTVVYRYGLIPADTEAQFPLVTLAWATEAELKAE